MPPITVLLSLLLWVTPSVASNLIAPAPTRANSTSVLIRYEAPARISLGEAVIVAFVVENFRDDAIRVTSVPTTGITIRKGARLEALVRLGVAALGAVALSGVEVPPQRHTQLAVDDGRPLAKAVELVQQRHGWVVTYEDPPLRFEGDVEDITRAVRRDGDYSKKVIAPRGGPFVFRYPEAMRDEPQPASFLQALLDAYHSSGLPGTFRLIHTEEVFHVVPSMSRNEAGVLVSRQSLLDARVTVEEQDRTALEMLQAILREVSRARGLKVWLGTIPVGLLAQTTVRDGAQHEPARDAIVRTLESTNQALSWQLLCDPAGTHGCTMNLLGVARR